MVRVKLMTRTTRNESNTMIKIPTDPEERKRVYDEVERVTRDAFAYIRSRPKSKSPLEGLSFEATKLNPAEDYRVASELPPPVAKMMRRLREENADNPAVLDALLELEWHNNPCALARRDAGTRAKKARFNMVSRFEAVVHGRVWNGDKFVDVDEARDPLPHGIPNRYAKGK